MDGNEGDKSDFPLNFSKAVYIDSRFSQLVEEIKTADIHLPSKPVIVSGMADLGQNTETCLVDFIEGNFGSKKLNAKSGCEVAHRDSTLISAYDESIAFFASLEGKVAYVSHSLVTMYKDQYYPLNHLNLVFCTKSKIVHETIPGAILATNWDVDTTINVEIAKQKRDFLTANAVPQSILLIDGPFMAGDGSFTFYNVIDHFIEKSIIPVFIVKNSNATILVDNLEGLKGNYNSDLHYANEMLSEGTRTPFFKYTTEQGNKSKVFCYIKHKDHYSPIRVEIPTSVFEKYRHSIEDVLDLIYYLVIVQGSSINPQVRLIAIAEKYARETLGLVNISKDTIQMKLTATMNEQRGME